MQLVKEVKRDFMTIRYYNIGNTTAYGYTKKIMQVTELSTGQGSKVKFQGHINIDADGEVRLVLGHKYSEKIKGYDY